MGRSHQEGLKEEEEEEVPGVHSRRQRGFQSIRY
jgi:hypothetical protein